VACLQETDMAQNEMCLTSTFIALSLHATTDNYPIFKQFIHMRFISLHNECKPWKAIEFASQFKVAIQYLVE
jgi:hypothetical protein